jgi:small ligand-binding sensory domain FIST
MFSCLGRGVHLYGEPDHDTKLLQRHLGALAVGGFFCNGEIGPVNGETFLHGYTSSIAIFRGPARV